MVTGGLFFLAADTARTRAYAGAMSAAGVRPRMAAILKGGGRPGQGGARVGELPEKVNGLTVPDPEMPLEELFAEAGWEWVVLPHGDVNHPGVAELVASHAPALTVYSGFGAQIVGEGLLKAASPLLHIHSGWLPEYRGSTTLYYSLLDGKGVGATALLIDRSIDTGPIVARRRYPPPPAGFDVDYLYDAMVRADLLVRVLGEWSEKGGFSGLIPQNPEEGETFYVIHPVLKHLALLSLEQEGPPWPPP